MRVLRSALLCLMAAGCASDDGGGPFGLVFLSKTQHVAGAEALFSPLEDQCLARPSFLVSMFSGTPDVTGLPPKLAETCKGLAKSFTAAAGEQHAPAARPLPADSIDPAQLRRNEIIDALIAASNRKCGRYVTFLKAYDGNVNVTFGLASLLTAGLSPIAGGEQTAKALGGASAILNGSRETFNQAHFANQTIQVLATAFDKARQTQRKVISNYEQCPLSQYSVMRGFEDAFRYHSECSVVYGFAEAARAVERANAPDLATMKAMLIELADLRKVAGTFTDPKAVDDAEGAPAVPAVKAKAPAVAAAAPPAAAVPPGQVVPPGAMPDQDKQLALSDAPTCPFIDASRPMAQGAQQPAKVAGVKAHAAVGKPKPDRKNRK